jgi:hypothetical protein
MSEGEVKPAADLTMSDEFTSGRRPRLGFSLGIVFAILLASLAAADFRDVLLARSHRMEALRHVIPGERLTRIERDLNAAGYQTLYSEGPPAWLQISTLQHPPVLSRLIGWLSPKSAFDKWIEDSLEQTTRFHLLADSNGVVRLTGEGTPEIRYLPPPAPLPDNW